MAALAGLGEESSMRFQACVLETTRLIVLWLIASPCGATPYFLPLGDLPGGEFYSVADSVSDDGSVVVGVSSSGEGQEAFRWTRGDGMVGLDDLAGGSFDSEAFDVSADGSVIVGFGSPAVSPPGSIQAKEAFRWTQPNGMVGLGPSGRVATGVSDDGSVVVGLGYPGEYDREAFRWTQLEGLTSLGHLPGGISSDAFGISGHGSVVVGQSDSSSGYQAYRWTPEGMVGLGDLPGFPFHSRARVVSDDGSVIVGIGLGQVGHEVFRWTQEGGMAGLGIYGEPFGISKDGSIVVGSRNSPQGAEAFIWDAEQGERSMQALLASQGLDLEGWLLRNATAIGDDGLTIVGVGTNPSGNLEAWMAEIPESSSLLLLVTGLGGLGMVRRSRA